MLYFLIDILIVCFFLSLYFWDVLTRDDVRKEVYAWGLYSTSSIVAIAITGIFVLVANTSTPNAIDVYRGKTELKINKEVINDSIVKCDSIVIFKDNIK